MYLYLIALSLETIDLKTIAVQTCDMQVQNLFDILIISPKKITNLKISL